MLRAKTKERIIMGNATAEAYVDERAATICPEFHCDSLTSSPTKYRQPFDPICAE